MSHTQRASRAVSTSGDGADRRGCMHAVQRCHGSTPGPQRLFTPPPARPPPRRPAAADEKDVSTSRYRTSVCAVPLAAPALVQVAEAAAP